MMRFFTQIAFVIPAILFLMHQFLERFAHIHIPLVDNYLDPLLCPIILLSFFLFERRYFIFKDPTYQLSMLETLVSTFFLAFLSEQIFPLLSTGFTTDILDYFAFFAGSIYFYFTINQSSS